MFCFKIRIATTAMLGIFLFISAVVFAAEESDIQNEELPLPEVDLNYFFTGSYAKYFVSSKPTDVITARETCKFRNKTLKLLSIENEDKFQEILAHLSATIGVEGVWTSGMEAVFKDSREFLWSSTALPLDYTNFAPTLGHLLTGLPGRYRRGFHGTNPSCPCNNECSEHPKCEILNCTVTGETCEIDQPTCTEPNQQDCYLVDPAPQCTVTCPECTLQRGNCILIQPVCTVKEGTPNCTTTRRGHCTVIPPTYEVVPGKCSVIQEPCAVTQPLEPCDRPVNCTFQYNPNPSCGGFGGSAPSFGGPNPNPSNLPRNCSMSCPPNSPCPNPCPTNDNCYHVFNCVPDRICQAPPIICPPPIHHCLPAELVKTSEETLDCDEPETVCDPPIVECTEVQKKCEEDVITCPAPQTVCTPAVSHCPRPDYTCSKPVIECQDPSVVCPELPQCQIPPKCYDNQGYLETSSRDCNCRGKRDIQSRGKLVAAKCVALKKSLGYKWTLEECNAQNYFICQENYHD